MHRLERPCTVCSEPAPQILAIGTILGTKVIVIFEKVYTPIVGKYMIAFLKW
jgi:hypothetical protein